MDEREQLEKLIESFIKIEQDRNELFKKALHIFLATTIGIVAVMSISQIVLFASMFE